MKLPPIVLLSMMPVLLPVPPLAPLPMLKRLLPMPLTLLSADEARAAADRAAVAADLAEDAAAVAAGIAGGMPVDPPVEPEPTPPPALSFTLEPGTERKLSEDVFLVCPGGGSPCHIESITDAENGQFLVQLADGSERPFFWDSSASFTALLGPYEHARVRLVGSENVHIVTCGQPASCNVSGLGINEQEDFEWSGSDFLHVSQDETGFFLLGERTVTYPDGKQVLFRCPEGCGVDRIYQDGQGKYVWEYDNHWEEPSANFVAAGGGQGEALPPEPTPPIQSFRYTGLPAELPKFSVNHFELSDEIFREEDYETGMTYLVRGDEVVCPGREPDGNRCTVGEQVLTTDYILDQLDGKISSFGGADEYGYFAIGPDVFLQQSAIKKSLIGEPLTDDEKALLYGFNVYGIWGDYSAFGFMNIPTPNEDGDPTISTHSFAFGDLYDRHSGGKPTAIQGSGIWRGHMMARWNNLAGTILDVGVVLGTSELEYDFENDHLDLTLEITSEVSHNDPYGGERVIPWHNVKQNGDGSFFIQGNHKLGTEPDPQLGILDGDFYGPNAEEVAGIFERIIGNYHLDGAFGGKRE